MTKTNEQIQNQCETPSCMFVNATTNLNQSKVSLETIKDCLKRSPELEGTIEFLQGYTLSQKEDSKYELLDRVQRNANIYRNLVYEVQGFIKTHETLKEDFISAKFRISNLLLYNSKKEQEIKILKEEIVILNNILTKLKKRKRTTKKATRK